MGMVGDGCFEQLLCRFPIARLECEKYLEASGLLQAGSGMIIQGSRITKGSIRGCRGMTESCLGLRRVTV